MATLAEIDQFLREHPDISDTGRPASDELIDKAAKFLGVRFPDEYRKFLRHWGTLAIGPLEFYGITGDEFETGSVPNAIWYTSLLRRREHLPKQFVILYNNEGDEYYLLDTDDPGGRVVVWDVLTRRVTLRAPTLFDFILAEVKGFIE